MRAYFIGFLLVFITYVAGVFDDEAFLVDWKIREVGKLKMENIVYSGQKILNVLTTANILAGLEDGEVRWRHSFEGLRKGANQRVIPSGDNTVITGLNFDDRSLVQSWDSVDGFLVNDIFESDSEIAEIQSDSRGNVIVVFINGKVSYIEKSGKLIFESDIEGMTNFKKITTFENGNFAILYDKDNCAFLAFYNGNELKYSMINADVSCKSIRDLYGSKLVYENNGHHYTVKINANNGSVSAPVAILGHDRFIVDIDTDEFYAVEKKHNIEIYRADGNLQFTIPNVDIYKLKFVDSVFILYKADGAQIIDADTGDEIHSFSFGDGKVPFEKIEAIYTVTNGVDEIETLFQFQNFTYFYFKNDNVSWTKDFALSEVLTHAIVDLPVENSITFDEIIYEEQKDLITAYIFRLRRHFSELRDVYNHLWQFLPSWVTGEYKYALKKNDRYFGFEKYFVLGTKSGRVISLNTLDGSVVWSYDLEQDDILQIENIGNKELFVFTKSGPRFVLDAFTGKLIKKDTLDPSKSITKLKEGTFLLELENGRNVVVSDKEELEDIYIVKQTSVISGFKTHNKNVSPTWSFRVREGEEIVGFSAKDNDQNIANVGIVLGNRSVLYKFLYPNLCAVGVINKATKTLYIYIIDSITGEVLHTVSHEEQIHLNERFNIVFGESWVVYTYWSNKPTPEQKIVVIDIFESIIPNYRPSIGNGSALSAFDARTPPHFVSKAFVLPYRIKNLAISKTKFGVTTKTIIAALENNQMIHIPKFVLNSRRVEGRQMTADNKLEFMLLPYDPIVQVDNNAVITHEREVIAGNEIIAIPTNLESTSIVCTYGLDVFCTRISPSLQFDKLTPSFDKRKLILSIIVLGVVLAVLRPMVHSKQLKNAWILEKQT